MSKLHKNAVEALKGLLFDGMTVMAGGFGLCGIPEHSIRAMRDAGVKNLTWIANNCGVDDFGQRHPVADAADQKNDRFLCR